MRLSTAFVAILLGVAQLPVAAQTAGAPQWATNGEAKIRSIQTSSAGFTKITLEGNNFNSNGCNPSGDVGYYFDPADANYKEKVAVAMSAMLSDRPVRLWLAGSSKCFPHPWQANVSFPRAWSIEMF